ncbi:MAG: amidohydrolase family protein [Anaerolineae bacterium]|nr:amidohydrolase family protein [Anaerolineae bacterium]
MGETVYCETCPQYLLLDERAYAGPRPAHYILQPPLRAEAEGEVIWSLVAEGAVDVISTDHCDYALEQKTAADDFTVTPGGLPGVETLLPLVYTYGVAEGRITLPQLVGLLSTQPARIFKLYPRKGVIQPGADADLVVYDPAPERTVRADALHYVARYSPYEGMALKGAVRATISRGEVIVQGGVFSGSAGRGQFVPARSAE